MIKCSLSVTIRPVPIYEIGAFNQIAKRAFAIRKQRMGILGVEPRLSPYKEPALTIKLYSQEFNNLLRDRCVFV
jgi:hypothetical protein